MSIFNENDRKVRKLKKIAAKIEALDDVYSKMSDAELMGMTAKLKARYQNGESLESLLVDAFATVREASGRTLHMKHFPVQLMGGIALYQGRIAEMATGEGKTLVATLPAYLYALTGKGVHIVTVNDYLAQRDADWMGNVYRFLGMSVGVVVQGMDKKEKQKAYAADITYCSNSELGFDFLRDNMEFSEDDVVQRELNYAIIDEVDSILIDEARTPLIISSISDPPTEDLIKAAKFVDKCNEVEPVLDKDGQPMTDEDGEPKTRGECEVDYEKRTVILTEEGLRKAEKEFETSGFFGIAQGEAEAMGEIEDAGDAMTYNRIMVALKAKFLFQRDKDYLLDDKYRVVIIDHNTGRAMPGRRFSEGLHQAIEAKEALRDKRVRIRGDNKLSATITYQNLFRQYKKISGMTGTAKTEEAEFKDIYKLDVVKIPTNKPCRRTDRNDKVFFKKEYQVSALLADIAERHEKGQPLLIGTTSVEESEDLSKKLTEMNISHEVLNARNNKNEAYIVAQAGALGAVTISTNMAGRGTDILLGGNPEYKAKKAIEEILADRYSQIFLAEDEEDEVGGPVRFERNSQKKKEEQAEKEKKKKLYFDNFVTFVLDEVTANVTLVGESRRNELIAKYGNMNIDVVALIDEMKTEYKKCLDEAKTKCAAQKQKVIDAGGLCVIGTGRNESRRIDNQLSGRAGRQGDIGESVFYVSLDDEIFRFNNKEKLDKLLTYLSMRLPGGQAEQSISFSAVDKFIMNTQKKIEGMHFVARRDLIYYDEVLEVQRKDIYSERKALLNNSKAIHEQITEMFEKLAYSIINRHVKEGESWDKWDIEGLTREYEERMLPLDCRTSVAGNDEFDDDEDEDYVEDEEIIMESEDDEDVAPKDDPEPKGHVFSKGSVITKQLCERENIKELAAAMCAKAEEEYNKKVEFYRAKDFDYEDEERFVLLTNIDRLWPDFLDRNNALKESVRLRAYGQHDPRIVFRKESMEMFDKLLDRIYVSTAEVLLRAMVPRRLYSINLTKASRRMNQFFNDMDKMFNSPKEWVPSDRTEIKQADKDEFMNSLIEMRARQIVDQCFDDTNEGGGHELQKLDKLVNFTFLVEKRMTNPIPASGSVTIPREKMVEELSRAGQKQLGYALNEGRKIDKNAVNTWECDMLTQYWLFLYTAKRQELNKRVNAVKLDDETVDAFLDGCERIFDRLYEEFAAMFCAYFCGHFRRWTLMKLSNKGMLVSDVKILRNDPCPCGSGKKYKNCCGKYGGRSYTLKIRQSD